MREEGHKIAASERTQRSTPRPGESEGGEKK